VVVPILREKSNLSDNWPITWTECTLRLKNWRNKVLKSLTAVSLLNFINDGTNQKKGTYKMREPCKSLTLHVMQR
jgi:hypothetical protein